MTAKIISLLNFKGGCTKTTSTCGIGAALADLGKKVLLVDLDPQAHVGVHLGIYEEEIEFAIEDTLVKGGKNIKKIIVQTEDAGLFLAPSKRHLLNARYAMERRVRRDEILAEVLKPVVNDYDFIIIDTPPDEGVLSFNALFASRYVIIPTPLDAFSLTGISTLLDCLEQAKEAYDHRDIDILGVLVNRYDARLKRQNTSNLAELKEYFGDLVFRTFIRSDENIRMAQDKGVSIISYNAASKGANDFILLAEEIMERLK